MRRSDCRAILSGCSGGTVSIRGSNSRLDLLSNWVMVDQGDPASMKYPPVRVHGLLVCSNLH